MWEITCKAGDESHSTQLESLPSQVAPLPQGMALCIQGPDPKMGALVLGNPGKGIPAPLEVLSGTTVLGPVSSVKLMQGSAR